MTPRPRRARFTVYRDRAKQWRWRLTAANSEIVADSAESYTRKADVTRAIKNTVDAVDNAVYGVYYGHLLRALLQKVPQTTLKVRS